MNKKRISKDMYYLKIAKVVSERSTCLRRQYGAVLVKNDEIIATGYNGSPRNEPNCCDNFDICPRVHMPHNSGNYNDCHSVHAEQNALLSASRSETIGSILYLAGFEIDDNGNRVEIDNAEPCPICSRMLKNAGVARIVSKVES